jgi:hypothetical protein
MSSSSEKREVYLGLFNDKVGEFISELCTSFPQVSQFSTFRTAFSIMKTLDCEKPRRIFASYVYDDFKDVIYAKDDEFFLTTKFNIRSGYVEYWQGFMDQLRALWTQLDDATKEIVWQYFILLCKLNEKCT